AKGLPLRPVGRGSMSAIIDHWASESTWNLDIWPVSQDGRYIFVRHALVLGEGTLRVQSASLEHGLAAGDHLLALLLGDLGQGEVVPDDRGREAKPGFEGSAYGSLPGDEH